MAVISKISIVFSWMLAAWILLLCVVSLEVTANDDRPAGESTRTGDSERPHIVLIVADDLGYDDVSFHGSDQIPTPNIDFLAYSGVLLNNYYVSPICTPTRAALLTGRHPIHTGLQDNVIGGGQPWGLPLNETILPQYLSKLGYRSHIVGKWHLGMFKWEYTPLYRGFESHFGFYDGCEDYYTHVCAPDEDNWGVDFRRNYDIAWNYTGEYSTFLFRDEAVDVINKHNKSEPLFLYLPFQAVHNGNGISVPLQAPAEYIDRFPYIENIDRRTYAGMVSALDDAIGVVYDALRDRDMLNNTIIVFTSDNGGPTNEYEGGVASNWPLRGMKTTFWEGGVRVVGFINSPLLKHQSYVSEKLLHVCDWLPTLISAAGGSHLLTNVSLDGVDAWAMLSEDGDPVRTELLHNHDPTQDRAALRVGDYKLLTGNLKMAQGGWYTPYQLAKDGWDSYYLRSDNPAAETVSNLKNLRARESAEYRKHWPDSVTQRLEELQTFAEKSGLYVGVNVRSKREHQRSSDRTFPYGGRFLSAPVTIKCGDKPSNASTNCDPTKSPCLYHIPSDPCEYNNIAAWNKDIVTSMLTRLSKYEADEVPTRNQPYEDASNPKLHGGAWEPWH